MSTFRQILKDENLNAQLREKGFVTVPFLNKEEVDYLVKFEWALTAEDILWRRTKLGLDLTEENTKSVEIFMRNRDN